jgi:hypothetical protein
MGGEIMIRSIQFACCSHDADELNSLAGLRAPRFCTRLHSGVSVQTTQSEQVQIE